MRRMIDRRRFVGGAAAALAPALISRAARAQAWPTRHVRLIVPFPPGGGTDAIARIVAEKLSEVWGQQMVVENRGGGASNIGHEAVVRADPDGYTMLFASMPLAVNRFLFPALSYDAINDLAPVSLICDYPNVMAVPVSSSANSVTDFIAHAKANPGKVTFASSGHGTSVHLSGELFKRMAGIDILHVPYRGAGRRSTISFPAASTCVQQHRRAPLIRARNCAGRRDHGEARRRCRCRPSPKRACRDSTMRHGTLGAGERRRQSAR